MTDPVIAMYDALAKADRKHNGRPWTPLTSTDPAYAGWKVIADGLLESCRAWFRGTRCRNLNTIARQVALAHTRTWRAEHGQHCDAEHVAHVGESAWYPAILALVATAHANAAEARAAELAGVTV